MWASTGREGPTAILSAGPTWIWRGLILDPLSHKDWEGMKLPEKVPYSLSRGSDTKLSLWDQCLPTGLCRARGLPFTTQHKPVW